MNKKSILSFLAGCVVGLLLLYGYFKYMPSVIEVPYDLEEEENIPSASPSEGSEVA